MSRPQLHRPELMLDAARSLLLSGGSRHATIEAIASTTGAPTGSIYHQFGSRDELIAKLWMRAIYRSQASFIAALEHEDPHTAALNAAMSVVTFCEQHPDDARLLVSFRREDLLQATPGGRIAEELKELNRPLERAVTYLAERIYGQRTREAINRTLLAVFDIPYGAVRRYLIAGEELPPGLYRDLPKAITAVLDSP